MKVIGFANKFYTLWEVTEETRDLGNGHHYVTTHNVFVKNISFDRETAFAAYPGVEFNEDLRGHTQSWNTTKKVWDNVDTFRFGKYKYDRITPNSDLNYLAWYWENVSGDHKEYVENVLKSCGYEVQEGSFGKHLVSPEVLENERKKMMVLNEKLAEVASATELMFTPDYNVDDEGYFCSEEDVLYHFPEVKENYYQGFPYYLPVLNGKAKRIKNKNVKIKKFTYSVDNYNRLVIEILDFEIVK